MDKRPVGILDSGLGGLTAVKEVLRLMPEEEIIYFGDTGRVPYGTRGREIVLKYTRQDINFLKTFDVKLIIVACGTISTLALGEVKDDYDIPVIGVVESAVEAACANTKIGKIAVIATQGSISSGLYEQKIKQSLPGTEVLSVACPLLVPLVENGRFDEHDPVIKLVLEEYLGPVKDFKPDTMILGCTHYPLLRDAIARCVGPEVGLIDPGLETARTVKDLLEREDMKGEGGGAAFYSSDSVENFEKYGGMFLSRPIEGKVFRVDIEKY